MKSYDTNSHSSDVAISCKASDRHLHLKNRNPDPSRGLRYIPPRTFDQRTWLRLGQDMIRNSTVTPSTRRRLATRLQRQLRYRSIDAVDAVQSQTSEGCSHTLLQQQRSGPLAPGDSSGETTLRGRVATLRETSQRLLAVKRRSDDVRANPH